MRRQRGITLLEMMIVLAIIAIVMGLIVGPKLIATHQDAEREVARLAVDRIAEQDYPMWALRHPSQQCPTKIADVTTGKNTKDPWGTTYAMYCGHTAPPDTAFGAASFGGDRRENTPDDIRSWDHSDE